MYFKDSYKREPRRFKAEEGDRMMEEEAGVLSMEEEVPSQGIQMTSRSWKR